MEVFRTDKFEKKELINILYAYYPTQNKKNMVIVKMVQNIQPGHSTVACTQQVS